MRTIKTAPFCYVQKTHVGEYEYATPTYQVLAVIDHDIKCMIRSFVNHQDALEFADSVNVAAYRWAISESND